MLVKKIYDLIEPQLEGLRIVKCFEYDTLFVFHTVPSSQKSDEISGLASHAISVNKKTGEIRGFRPFHIPVDEYRRGKEILDFK